MNYGKSTEKKIKSLAIKVLGNDFYEIKGIRTSSSELVNALRNELEKGYGGSVIIDGSENASSKDVVFAMKTAHRSGAKGIALTRELTKKMEAEGKVIIRERIDSKSAISEFASVIITILENGDYEIDGIQIKPSSLEQALTELKVKRINHPRTILQIRKQKEMENHPQLLSMSFS